MVDFGGFSLPDIDITGFLSNSWFYVFIIGVFGFIFIAAIAVLLFYRTYNKKIVVFENISGQGYQPVIKTRARVIKLGIGGEEVLKTLAGGHYVSAYGRKMGKNTFWFCKGLDGYWYNIILGDVDTKLAMLDVEPVDRDVRMFHVALDRLSQQTYGKTSFMEKYGVQMLMFLFLIVLILGMWFIVGKVGDSTKALSDTAQTNERVASLLEGILKGSDNIANRINSGEGSSGLTPVDIGG